MTLLNRFICPNVKTAGDAELSYAMKGELYLTANGNLQLSVPNNLARGVFDSLHEVGIELPSKRGLFNAHVTVASREELATIGGGDKISERGHSFSYTLGPLREVVPAGWAEMSRVWFLEVRSPELEKLRKSYGLPAQPPVPFHLTVAVRRKSVTRPTDVVKHSSILGNPAGYDAENTVNGVFDPEEYLAKLGNCPTCGAGCKCSVRDGTYICHNDHKYPAGDAVKSAATYYHGSPHGDLTELHPGSYVTPDYYIAEIMGRYHPATGKTWTDDDLAEPYGWEREVKWKPGREPQGQPTVYSLTAGPEDLDLLGSVHEHKTTGPVSVLKTTKSARFFTRQEIMEAGKQVNTSPTPAQQEAGNYQKAHIHLHGLNISIENPKGSIRRGISKDGKSWESKLHNHYGYIKRTLSEADGDNVDVFVGDNPESEIVYVVDQVDPDTGKWDEHKAMLSFHSFDDAEQAYLSNYEDGWQGLDDMTAITMNQFKDWLNDGDTSKPLNGQTIKLAKEMAFASL
jgi:hypothetical protein